MSQDQYDFSLPGEEAIVCDMEKQEILSAINDILADIENVLFRHKHYAKSISPAYIETIKSDLRFILQRHS